MEREFTKPYGRYAKGERRDYPLSVWHHYFKGFERYTKLIEAPKPTTEAKTDAEH